MSEIKIAVFILAENRLLREALTRLLSKKDDIRVVGASAFSPRVIEQIVAANPEVLLSDSLSAGLSNLQLIPEVRAAAPSLKVVLIGMDSRQDVFLQAVREGVVGYVLKEASAREVACAVRAVANDQAVCPPDLCMSLFQQVAAKGVPTLSFDLKHNLGLSRREQQLVQMIGLGLTNKEIASQLSLSEQTVKNHVHRMLRKLGASDRFSAVERCRMPNATA